MSTLAEFGRGTPRAPGLEVLLHAVMTLFAFSGGLSMMADPDGSSLGLNLSMLANAPFGTFFVPGLLLVLVVGGLNATAWVLTISKSAAARLVSLAAGLAVLGFVFAELVLLPHRHLAQLIAAATGLAIALLALLGRDRFRP